MQESIIIPTAVSREEAKRQTVRALKAIGSVEKVDDHTASGSISTLGRRTHIEITWVENRGKAELEITASTFEVGSFATESAVNRFVDTFRNIDKPGFLPDSDGMDGAAQRLIVFAILSFIALIIVGGFVLALLQNGK